MLCIRSFFRIFAAEIFINMNILGRLFIYIRRINHCKGFGVQSPFAYKFITDVINEHYSYYSYKDLDSLYPQLDVMNRKLCRLYFRISNFCQADYFVDSSPDQIVYSDYIRYGCRKMEMVRMTELLNKSEKTDNTYIVRLSATGDCKSWSWTLLDHLSENSVIIVQDIHQNKDSKAFWRQLQNCDQVGITFDLYYAGIIFLDVKRYKQNYIVNF